MDLSPVTNMLKEQNQTVRGAIEYVESMKPVNAFATGLSAGILINRTIDWKALIVVPFAIYAWTYKNKFGIGFQS